MATNVVPFMQANLPVPAHIAKFLSDNANIDPKDTIPQLSFRGKVWRIVLDGEETVVTKDEEPVSTVRVVVLDHNKARSRTFYEGAYDPKKPMPPSCWSLDGVTPDSDVQNPQCDSCAKCPQSVKGSKITDNGKETTACSVYKRIVLVPHADLAFQPLLLKLPQTSMWDGKNEQNEAKGWYAWDQYIDMLRTRGVVHTCTVITKIKFDARVEYPKLLFAAQDFLTPEDFGKVTKLVGTDAVTSLLKVSDEAVAKRVTVEEKAAEVVAKAARKTATPPPEDEEDDDSTITVEEEDEAPPPPAAKKKKAAAAPPPEDEEDEAPPPVAKKKKAAVLPPEDEEDDDAPPPPAAKKKKAAAPPPDEDEGEEEAPPPAAKKKAKAGAAGLGDLMAEWDAEAE